MVNLGGGLFSVTCEVDGCQLEAGKQYLAWANFHGGIYTGTNFSVNGETTTPTGITWDGVNFWVIEITTDVVYKYTAAGVYTGTI